MLFCLYIEFLTTGHTRVETFSTSFHRALMVIALSSEPAVRLRLVDVPESAHVVG